MSICGRCRRNNAKDAQFCAGCGSRLPPEPPGGYDPAPGGDPSLEGLRAVVHKLVAERMAEPEGGVSAPRPIIDVGQQAQAASQVRKGSASLTLIQRDGSDGQSFAVFGDQMDIGRTEGVLTFDDPHLAPRHARIMHGPSGYVLSDLGTRNGVYRRLRGPVELDDGDQILLGKQVLQFTIVADFQRTTTPSIDTGTLLFGTPVAPAWGRLSQITLSGVARDMLHLSRQDVVLGRDQGDIVFSDDEFMSRRHAQLSIRDGRAKLEDLGSSNGTFIRLRGLHALSSGDFIRIGDELLRFDLG